jgi:hypothetical protein
MRGNNGNCSHHHEPSTSCASSVAALASSNAAAESRLVGTRPCSSEGYLSCPRRSCLAGWAFCFARDLRDRDVLLNDGQCLETAPFAILEKIDMRNTLIVAVVSCLIGIPAKSQTLLDDFNAEKLDTSKWTTQQIRPDQMSFGSDNRCGARSITVTVREGDGGSACEDDCQRAELRTSSKKWPEFGAEVWFSFSFKNEGDVPATGSARSVIGQWIGPGDHSPMMAQRFDNGVFHITVQDNEVRRVVAKAEGDPDRMVLAQQILGRLDPRDERTVNAVRFLQSLDLLMKTQPDFSREFFSEGLQRPFRLLGDQRETERLSESIGLSDSALISEFDEVSFVAEPEKYLGDAQIEITSEANRVLPDPRKGWVDMVSRIKPGRTDNEVGPKGKGEVEVCANGNKIVTVRGNMGATLKKEQHPEPSDPISNSEPIDCAFRGPSPSSLTSFPRHQHKANWPKYVRRSEHVKALERPRRGDDL